jgi:hypothetical protein
MEETNVGTGQPGLSKPSGVRAVTEYYTAKAPSKRWNATALVRSLFRVAYAAPLLSPAPALAPAPSLASSSWWEWEWEKFYSLGSTSPRHQGCPTLNVRVCVVPWRRSSS